VFTLSTWDVSISYEYVEREIKKILNRVYKKKEVFSVRLPVALFLDVNAVCLVLCTLYDTVVNVLRRSAGRWPLNG